MKYDRMIEYKQALSREKIRRAQAAIGELIKEREAVSVTVLAKKTGLSRAFFYKNGEVRSFLAEARLQQRGLVFQKPQKAVLDKAMSVRLDAIEKQLEREHAEKERLKKENMKLQKALGKKDLGVLRGL